MNIEELRKLLKENNELNTILYITKETNDLEKQTIELTAKNNYLLERLKDKEEEIKRLMELKV